MTSLRWKSTKKSKAVRYKNRIMARTKCPHGISPKSNCDICRKEYNKKYRQSPTYKESRKKYRESAKYKESLNKYHQSLKYKRYQRKYLQLKKMEASLK
jgi:hypothetical protein